MQRIIFKIQTLIIKFFYLNFSNSNITLCEFKAIDKVIKALHVDEIRAIQVLWKLN